MSAPTTIAAIGPAFWDVFTAVEMHRTCSSFTGAKHYFDVVNEVLSIQDNRI
jgi:hypothetical protein